MAVRDCFFPFSNPTHTTTHSNDDGNAHARNIRSSQDACISSGSIFGIYTPGECVITDADGADAVLEKCLTNARRAGTELAGAGYILYSAATVLVLTLGHGVFSFTLDRGVGEFVLTDRCASGRWRRGWAGLIERHLSPLYTIAKTRLHLSPSTQHNKTNAKQPLHSHMTIPDPGQRIYSGNEGNAALWDPDLRAYVDERLKAPGGADAGGGDGSGGGGKGGKGRPHSYRYIGALVGDFHRTLCYGGEEGERERGREGRGGGGERERGQGGGERGVARLPLGVGAALSTTATCALPSPPVQTPTPTPTTPTPTPTTSLSRLLALPAGRQGAQGQGAAALRGRADGLHRRAGR